MATVVNATTDDYYVINDVNMSECYAVYIYPYVDYTQNDVVRYAFVVAYVIVVCLSLLGNLMVMWTVYANKRMRTVTNYYIVNLAASDFLVAAIVMPLKLVEYTVPCEWSLFASDALCSFVYFVLPVFVFVSVLTLVAISVERFVAIVLPLSARAFTTKSRTRRIIAISWLIAIVTSLPYLLCRSYPFTIHSHLGFASRRICNDRFDDLDRWISPSASDQIHAESAAATDPENGGGDVVQTTARPLGRFRKGFFMFLFVGMYLIPAGIILYTCIHMSVCLMRPAVQTPGRVRSTAAALENSKRKIVRVIIAVATSFLASWAPFYLVTFVSQTQEKSFLRHSNFLFAMLGTQLAGFANSCINPFIYNILCDSFRSSFRRILATPFRCWSGSGSRSRGRSIEGGAAAAAGVELQSGASYPVYRPSWRISGILKDSDDAGKEVQDDAAKTGNGSSSRRLTVVR